MNVKSSVRMTNQYIRSSTLGALLGSPSCTGLLIIERFSSDIDVRQVKNCCQGWSTSQPVIYPISNSI